jgi:hypothetical protein
MTNTTYFNDHNDHNGPEHKRDHAVHGGGVDRHRSRRIATEHRLDGIQRARADVAEHNPQRANDSTARPPDERAPSCMPERYATRRARGFSSLPDRSRAS